MSDTKESSIKVFFLVLGIGLAIFAAVGSIAFFAIQRDPETSEKVTAEETIDSKVTSVAVSEYKKTAAFKANDVLFSARPTEEEARDILPQMEEMALAPLKPDIPDPAIGEVAPELSGTDFAGEPVEIKADGRPKVIYFLAHWCSACQQEVPELQEMLDEGLLPENLDIYSVSSLYRPDTGNSPEIWFDREGWTPPVLRDNQISSAFDLYVQGAGTPAFIYLDGENKVVYRGMGALGRERTLTLWNQAAEGTLKAATPIEQIQ